MSTASITRQTFRWELLRSIPNGALDTLASTFAMIIAVRAFAAGDGAKSVLLASNSAGMILSLALVPILLRTGAGLTRMATGIQLLAAACLIVASLFPHSSLAVLGGMSGSQLFLALQVPLITAIYQANYPAQRRGQLFAITNTTRAAAAMAMGFAGGWWLGRDAGHYPWLLWAFSAALILSALSTLRLPYTQPPEEITAGSRSLIGALRWIREDRTFRRMLISWMVLGMGNLIAMALFVEFLANPKHGIDLPEKDIAWIVGVVPLLFRLIFSYPWGMVFDRVNFFIVRSSLNVFFALSIFIFFHSHHPWGWTVAMALFGFANAGGQLTWSLWVTKLAPPHAVAEYMAVHTFLTGLRGVIAPSLGFLMIQHMSFETLSIVCVTAILAASGFILVPPLGSFSADTTSR
ncbi:MAG: MFS transporter [Verrucomicrobiales bacterium]|nr:MFS transporter [Verrucomicrobiales bacterium]